MERRLIALLSADVTRGTHQGLGKETGVSRPVNTYQKIIEALVEQHRGRVVHGGDGALLVEFPSVIEAVQCALVVQSTLLLENVNRAPTERSQFRLGIHLGDVTVEDDHVYGNGVHVATRVRELATPNGIGISAAIYEQIKGRIAIEYEDGGLHKVTNSPESVHLYRVQAKHGTMTEPAQARRHGLSSGLPLGVVVGGIVALLLAVLFVGMNQTRFFSRAGPGAVSVLPLAQTIFPAVETPTLAVLPFLNLSNDPGQEYFSDGMTEDLITDLSQISRLFVIARNSVFTFKGKAAKVQEVGRELGVQYVLEGSVRKSAGEVRISAQLVDAGTGFHLWSERYERPLSDLFTLEDDIRQKIVTALKVKLTSEEQERLRRAPTSNLEAYDYYLRALTSAGQATAAAQQHTRAMLNRAIALDPQYGAAYALLGATYLWEWVNQHSDDPNVLDQARALAQRALVLNEALPLTQRLLSGVYLWKDKDHARAITAGEKALALDPNDADSYVELAGALSYVGRTDEAVKLLQKAMRLNPRYPSPYLFGLGHVYHAAWKNNDAVTVLKRYVVQNPDALTARIDLACTYSELGYAVEARTEIDEILRLKPNFSLQRWQERSPWADAQELAHHIDNLRNLGLQ